MSEIQLIVLNIICFRVMKRVSDFFLTRLYCPLLASNSLKDNDRGCSSLSLMSSYQMFPNLLMSDLDQTRELTTNKNSGISLQFSEAALFASKAKIYVF